MSRVRNQRNCKKAAAGSIYRVSCSASDFEEGELISGVKAGDKLKVKESRIIYHSPKHKVTMAQSATSGLLFKKHQQNCTGRTQSHVTRCRVVSNYCTIFLSQCMNSTLKHFKDVSKAAMEESCSNICMCLAADMASCRKALI